MKLCVKLLSDSPAFVIINTYTGGLSGTVIQNLLRMKIEEERRDLINKGNFVTNEIGLKMEKSDVVLPCGITTKWEEV